MVARLPGGLAIDGSGRDVLVEPASSPPRQARREPVLPYTTTVCTINPKQPVRQGRLACGSDLMKDGLGAPSNRLDGQTASMVDGGFCAMLYVTLTTSGISRMMS